MKKILAASALGLALVAGTASADKINLVDEQLDNVNAGLGVATAGSTAGATGLFFSRTDARTATVTFSAVLLGLGSSSASAASSTSIAF